MPDEALATARAIDDQLARGDAVGPMAGVPVTIKVNADQIGHANTNGLKLQKDNVVQVDNPVVANLKRAGAVIVGRTNTPAFSMRWFTRNTVHGHTRNPRNMRLTPGGSSGGAAAAVAAGIGPIGHGTDIAGSIRYPAYACGIHGIRPTLGRVPNINLSAVDRHIGAQITAVAGPLARSVADLRLGLQAMAAASVDDPWWVPAPLVQSEFKKTIALCIEPEGLAVEAQVASALEGAAARLRDAGWVVEEVACPPLKHPAELQIKLWLSELRRNGTEIIAKENDPDALFVYEQFDKGWPASDLNEFLDILRLRSQYTREWMNFMSTYSAVLLPISGQTPFIDNVDVESSEQFNNVIAAQMTQIGLPLLGLPAIAVATESTNDIPMGVQLVASRYREDVLFAAADAIAPTPIAHTE